MPTTNRRATRATVVTVVTVVTVAYAGVLIVVGPSIVRAVRTVILATFSAFGG